MYLVFAKLSGRFGKSCRSLYDQGQENSRTFSNKTASIQISIKKRNEVRKKAQNPILQFYDSKSRITSSSNHEKTVPDTATLVFALHCVEQTSHFFNVINIYMLEGRTSQPVQGVEVVTCKLFAETCSIRGEVFCFLSYLISQGVQISTIYPKQIVTS